jgi:GT2 family glycosyltransferase
MWLCSYTIAEWRTGMQPRLSIIIATHNRYDDLHACINALVEQPAVQECEVIVVDSASNYECKEKIEKLIEKTEFATLHRLDEPGVARARNLGAKVSTASWFATLDDDAIPRSDWAQNALDICSSASPDIGIVQGRVDPLWPVTPPPQIGELWRRYLSIVQRNEDCDMTANHSCAGANMLVNKRAWATIRGYNSATGRVGQDLASGIDTDLAQRIIEQGLKIHYSNRIVVLHKIHQNRLTKEWIAQRALKEGEAQGRICRRSDAEKAFLALKILVAVPVLYIAGMVLADQDDLLVKKQIDLGILRSLLSKGGSVHNGC